MRGEVHELQLDLAFTALSDRMALDPIFRNSNDPSFFEPCWAAYQDYLKRKGLKRKPQGRKHRRGRGSKVHVSSLSSEAGHNCDRYLFYSMTYQPQEPSTVVSMDYPVLIGALERCFWYGHGAEDEIYRLLGWALDNYYGEDLDIHEIVFERPIFTDPPEICIPDEKILAGTCDIYIRYSYKGGPVVTAVWDVKTISVGRSEKQQKSQKSERMAIASGGRAGEPNAQANYQRQVNGYLEPCRAHHGGLLYWQKQWKHCFSQFVVNRRPGLYAASMDRVRDIREDAVRDKLPPANRRTTWCGECPFQLACTKDDEDQEC